MKINLNDYVKVKLTEHGVKLYEINRLKLPELENSILKIQLWELMQLYGVYMYNGNPNLPFESMEVEIERAP